MDSSLQWCLSIFNFYFPLFKSNISIAKGKLREKYMYWLAHTKMFWSHCVFDLNNNAILSIKWTKKVQFSKLKYSFLYWSGNNVVNTIAAGYFLFFVDLTYGYMRTGDLFDVIIVIHFIYLFYTKNTIFISQRKAFRWILYNFRVVYFFCRWYVI